MNFLASTEFSLIFKTPFGIKILSLVEKHIMKNNFDIPLLRFWNIKYKGGSNYINAYVKGLK